MRIKEGFVIRDVLGQTVVVPTGEAGKDFTGMIKLNETGKDIWTALNEGKSEEQIVRMIIKEYDVTEERARAGVEKFLRNMMENGFLEM